MVYATLHESTSRQATEWEKSQTIKLCSSKLDQKVQCQRFKPLDCFFIKIISN